MGCIAARSDTIAFIGKCCSCGRCADDGRRKTLSPGACWCKVGGLYIRQCGAAAWQGRDQHIIQRPVWRSLLGACPARRRQQHDGGRQRHRCPIASAALGLLLPQSADICTKRIHHFELLHLWPGQLQARCSWSVGSTAAAPAALGLRHPPSRCTACARRRCRSCRPRSCLRATQNQWHLGTCRTLCGRQCTTALAPQTEVRRGAPPNRAGRLGSCSSASPPFHSHLNSQSSLPAPALQPATATPSHCHCSAGLHIYAVFGGAGGRRCAHRRRPELGAQGWAGPGGHSALWKGNSPQL